MTQTVLVIGGGGREHAIAWALAKSPQVSRIYVAPGNAGTEWSAAPGRAESVNVAINADDRDALFAFARDSAIDFTVVGPEDTLVGGIVDQFVSAGLSIFGPTAAAAQLEGSKAFAKDFMQRQAIPTAEYGAFTDYEDARDFIESFGRPVVVKADGLAEGKGVIVCETISDAEAALKRVMLDRAFGASGDQVVIEERLTGPEASALTFCDGKTIALMPIARDHKRALDGDMGLNTGGMGAVCPVPDVDDALRAEIEDVVIRRVIDGMAKDGTPYRGVLFAGLMLTPNGLRVLEYNCRFGDPETEAILPLLETDLLDILTACANGTLDKLDIRWKSGASAAVIVASGGYPNVYAKGLPVTGLDDDGETAVFHAGTANKDGQVVTTRGRVLAVSGQGETLDAALDKAYNRINSIHFDGMFYRKDIGRTVKVTG